MEIVTPLLSPYVKSTKNEVRLMTHSGSVVVLPHDLRIPFIKYVAMQGINSMRRFSVDRVYREKRTFNFHPKQMYECAFDIITPSIESKFINYIYLFFKLQFCFFFSYSTENQLFDAELISIGYSLITILPDLDKCNLSFRINHTSLLKACLIYFNVPTEKYDDIFEAITDYSVKRISKFQLYSTVKVALESSKQNAGCLIDTLITEIPLDGPQTLSGNLRNIMKGQSDASKMAKAAMKEIERVVLLSQNLGVSVNNH